MVTQKKEILIIKCKEEYLGKDISRFKNCSCIVSNVLTKESSKGKSYCKVEDKSKILSFFFAAGNQKLTPKITFDQSTEEYRFSSEENHGKFVGDAENTISSDSKVLSRAKAPKGEPELHGRRHRLLRRYQKLQHKIYRLSEQSTTTSAGRILSEKTTR